ncbi:MAG: hypothetical protein MUC29_05640 [Pyrinomonadaceae bacterium]|nr:hypothetical protein [Pyrinomonadaceae bacterium]
MKIAQLDAQIRANHFSNVQLFNDLTEAQRELGLLQGSRPTCPFLRPHFISRQKYNAISHAAEVLHTAFEAMTNVALENAEMLSLLDLTEAEERMARINPRYKNLCVTSRLDTFLCGEDFKFLEYNAESPAGIGDQMQLEIVLEKIPEVKDFLANNQHWRPKPHVILLESLLAAYREFGGKKEKPNIAIVDWKDVATGSEFVILQDYFNSKGFQTQIFDPHELEYDGEKLHVGDFVIDIFYKRVIIHEFLEKFDETHPFSRAYTDGKVCMANSFRVKIPHKKASFAILSDEKYAEFFSNEQLGIIKKHIPWTRKISDSKTTFHGETVDLLELLCREQSKFVLKPNDDYGGKGISFGWESSQSDWQTAIENALQDSFVVQERVPIEKFTFPTYSENVEMIELLVDFDPFLFMGKVEGGLVRLSSSSLVNVTQGGGQTALIVLED